MASNSIYRIVGLAGIEGESGGFRIFRDPTLRVELPERFDIDGVKHAQKDCEIMAEIARKYPLEIVEMQNAALSGNLRRAKNIADRIGLNEEHFISLGGGQNQSYWILYPYAP